MFIYCSILLLLLSSGRSNADTPRERALSLVEQALQYIEDNGIEQALNEFNSKDSKFLNDELYIFVFDFTGNVYAHGANTSLVGMDLYDLRDPNGDYPVRMMIDQAKKGHGWVTYIWRNPLTMEYEKKHSFVCQIFDINFFIGCGFYSEDFDPVY